MKNTDIINLVVQKFDFWGSTLGGGSKRKWHPQTMSKCLSVQYLLISKKKYWHPILSQAKNLFLMGPFWGISRRYSPMMSKHSSIRYVLILFKKTNTLVWANQKIDFWGVCFGVVPERVAPPNYVKIFISKIFTANIKKHWHCKLSRSKDWIWGDLRVGDSPKPRQNICILNTYWQQKTLAP